MSFEKVLVAGTFDRLHEGHKCLLITAIKHCKKDLVVGITNDHMLKQKKHSSIIQPFHKRKQNVVNFFSSLQWAKCNTTIVQINNKYDFAATDSSIQCLVVSEETLNTAKEINALREKNNISKFVIICCPTIPFWSSTRLRSFEVLQNQTTFYLLGILHVVVVFIIYFYFNQK